MKLMPQMLLGLVTLAAIADGEIDPKVRNDPATLASTSSAIPRADALRPPLPTKSATSSRPVSASGPSASKRSRGRSPGGDHLWIAFIEKSP